MGVEREGGRGDDDEDAGELFRLAKGHQKAVERVDTGICFLFMHAIPSKWETESARSAKGKRRRGVIGKPSFSRKRAIQQKQGRKISKRLRRVFDSREETSSIFP